AHRRLQAPVRDHALQPGLDPAARDLHAGGRRRPGRNVGLDDRDDGGRAEGPRGRFAAPSDLGRPVRQPDRLRPAALGDARRGRPDQEFRPHAGLQHRPQSPGAGGEPRHRPAGGDDLEPRQADHVRLQPVASHHGRPFGGLYGPVLVADRCGRRPLFCTPDRRDLLAGADDLPEVKRDDSARRLGYNRGVGWLLLALLETFSLYVWTEPDDKLLAFCAEKKVTRLYLMFSGKETPKLRAFVQSAKAAMIEVHAMHPGDMADWLDPFPTRLDPKPILEWVDAALKTGLFDGIHLDIEPHAAGAWKTHRLKLAAGYLDLLRQVRAKGKFTFGAAVPHNWDRAD